MDDRRHNPEGVGVPKEGCLPVKGNTPKEDNAQKEGRLPVKGNTPKEDNAQKEGRLPVKGNTPKKGGAPKTGVADVHCRDLGEMDYKACWDLQQQLFDTMVAQKAAEGGTSGAVGANPTPKAHGIPQATATQKIQRATTTQEIQRATTTQEIQRATTTQEIQRATATHEDTAGDNGTGDTAGDNGTGDTAGDNGTGDAGGTKDTTGAGAPSTGNDPRYAGELLLVEHPPVYTLGKSGHAENLLIGREGLEKMGAQFFHIDRGGDITFHGPGQLVGYPILDLEKVGIGLREYIEALEEAVIRTVAAYGITAGRSQGASGVWIEDGGAERKICAIGVRSSRYITMHGFALNVSTDLEWFSRINPCGFVDRGVTSIEREAGRKVPMNEVKALVVKFLGEILNVRIYK